MTDDDSFAELAARLEAQPEQLQPRPGSQLPGYRVRPHEDHGVAGSLVDQLDALPRRLKGQRRAVLLAIMLVGFAPVIWFGPISLIRALATRTPIPDTMAPLLLSFAVFIAVTLAARRFAPSAAAERLMARIAAERRLAHAIDQLPPGQVLPLWDRVLPGTELRVPLIAVSERGISIVMTAVGGPWTQAGREWSTSGGKVLAPDLAVLDEALTQMLYTLEQHPSMTHPRIIYRSVPISGWLIEVTEPRLIKQLGDLPGSLPARIGRINICTVDGFGDALESRLPPALSKDEAHVLHHLFDELAPPAPHPL